MVVTWWVFAVVLFVGSYVLFAMSDTYVPRRVGPRRLIPYELVLPVVSAVIVLWGIDRLLKPGWRLFCRSGAARCSPPGHVLAVLTAGMLAPAPSTASDEPDREPGLTSVGYEAYRWIAANMPADARVLANAYTDGSLAASPAGPAILDGRAVYLEDPTFLAESTNLVLGARVVFAEPDGPAAADYLTSRGVDYLLVAGPAAQGSDLGGYRPFETDCESLAHGGRYTLVRTFGDGRLLLSRVAHGVLNPEDGPALDAEPAAHRRLRARAGPRPRGRRAGCDGADRQPRPGGRSSCSSASGLAAVAIVPGSRPCRSRTCSGSRASRSGGWSRCSSCRVAIAYLLLFYALARADRANQRVSRLVRALSAAQVEACEHRGERWGGVLVCIPAFNEAESLPGVLAEVPAEVAGLPTHVLVIDDGSRDAHAAVVARPRRTRRQPPGEQRPGRGAADRLPRRRAAWCRRRRDARCRRPARSGRDGSAGRSRSSRTRPTSSSDRAGWATTDSESRARDAGITVYTRLINLLGGTEVERHRQRLPGDPRLRLAEIAFTEDQFHNPELLLGAARAGLRVLDVPVTHPASHRRVVARRARTCATAWDSCG